MPQSRAPLEDPETTAVEEPVPTPFSAEPAHDRAESWPGYVLPGAVDVSVCIANWNCREMLRGCLESLHDRSQGVHLETIVVDNASGDGAADMVARDFPGVRLIRNAANLGFAKANNQAAAHARGRYLFFLNNDTVVPPDALRRLVAYADANPHVGMVGPLLRDGDGHMQASFRLRPTLTTFLHRTRLMRWTGLLRRGYRRYRRQPFDRNQPMPVDVLMGAAMLVPRAVFFGSGRWDEDYHFGGEDLDLCYRVGRCHPLVFLPQVEITHYGRVSTRQHIGFAWPQIAVGFVRYLRKTDCPRPALLAYKMLITVDAPIHWLTIGVQYLWRLARGRRDKADKSMLELRGLGRFILAGMGAFWKA